jgi:hypothetical protein
MATQGFTAKEEIQGSSIRGISHVLLLGQGKGYSCGLSVMGTDGQFCLLCGDNEEAEKLNCNSKTTEERKSSPSAQQCQVPYQHHDKGGYHKIYWIVMPHPPYSPDLALSDFHPNEEWLSRRTLQQLHIALLLSIN